MPKESRPLQQDMFTGQWVDNRSGYRRRLDHEREQPTQMEMFTAREVVHLGTSRRPWLKDLPTYRLELISEDHRTPEEIERDLMREAQSLTKPMFEDDSEGMVQEIPQRPWEPAIVIAGYRARIRMSSVPARRRRTPVETTSPK